LIFVAQRLHTLFHARKGKCAKIALFKTAFHLKLIIRLFIFVSALADNMDISFYYYLK